MKTPQTDAADVAAEPAATSTTRKRRQLLTLLKFILAAVIVYFVGRAIVQRINQLDWDQVNLNFAVLLAALGFLLLQRVLAASAGHMVLRSLGGNLRWFNIYPIVWTATLGKYIPGKVASVMGYVFLAKRFGVRLPVAVGSSLLSTLLTVAVGLLISSPLLFTKSVRNFIPGGWVWAVLLAAAAIIFLYPPVFVRICNVLLRRLGRPVIDAKPNTRLLVLTMLLIALRCGTLGMGVWLIARSFTDVSITAYPLFIATATCASVIGFMAFFAPVGIGVREGIYLAVLGPVLGPAGAAFVAVLTRLVETLADICTGATGAVMLRYLLGAAKNKRTSNKPVENLVTKS